MRTQKTFSRVAVADLVFDELKRRILEFELKPGDRLIEKWLAEEFQVSVTPVREALLRLVQHGLADNALAKGIWVRGITPEEIADVFEMRGILEPQALRQSAPLTSNKEWSELSALLERAGQHQSARDHVVLAEINAEFHAGLRKHCQNGILIETISRMSERHRLITRLTWSADGNRANELAEHINILELARDGQVEEAANQLRRHILAFRDRAVEIARRKET